MTTVVGIDPSLASTGLCCLGTHRDGEVALVKSTGKDADDWPIRSGRLDRVTMEIFEWVLTRTPELVVMEGPSFDSKGKGSFDRAGLWWQIYRALRSRSNRRWPWQGPIIVTPSGRMKYATGKGQAPKDAVFSAVVRRYSHPEVTNNNEADALVFAAMGMRHLGAPVEASLPLTHLAAMEAVRWPE